MGPRVLNLKPYRHDIRKYLWLYAISLWSGQMNTHWNPPMHDMHVFFTYAHRNQSENDSITVFSGSVTWKSYLSPSSVIKHGWKIPHEIFDDFPISKWKTSIYRWFPWHPRPSSKELKNWRASCDTIAGLVVPGIPFQIDLLGGLVYLPLWKIMDFVSWGYYSQYMESHKNSINNL